MKYAVVLLALCAVAYSLPLDDSANAQIVVQESDNIGVDKYNYRYETSDGKSANEQGELTDVGTDDEAIFVRGSYSYVGEDGVTYKVDYTAGRDGFQPTGAHIPQA